MSRLASLGRRRITLLALVVAALTATLSLVSSLPAAAIVCNINAGSCPGTLTTYYSGPEHKKVVGECSCGSCSGEQTAYFTEHPVCCPCD